MPKGRITSTEKLAVELYELKWNMVLDFRKLLFILYHEKNLTMQELANTLYVSKFKAYEWIREYGIPAKTNGNRKKTRLRC